MPFDHVVQVREPKTGRVLEENHYILHINDKGTRYERPPHSGKFYSPDGKLVEDQSVEREKIAREKAEIERKRAEEEQEKIEREKREKLKAELRAEIDAEQKLAAEKAKATLKPSKI